MLNLGGVQINAVTKYLLTGVRPQAPVCAAEEDRISVSSWEYSFLGNCFKMIYFNIF